MCKVTSAGPVLIGGVAVAEAIGICIEFCAAVKVGSIKPPPAKALASRNRRRDKLLSSCSFIVRRFSRRRGLQATELSSGSERNLDQKMRLFLTERED
jgi:hypothetical protein